MMLARVCGTVVASVKNAGLSGKKLLLVQPINPQGVARGRPFVAIDAIGAGYGETVYWCRGREASLAFEPDVPTDATIVGIVDELVPAAPPSPPPAGASPEKNHSNNRRSR